MGVSEGWTVVDGSGDGPRVHTGIVTPPPPLALPPTTNSGGTAVLSSQLHRSATDPATATYLLSPLSPRRKLISSPCTCIHVRVDVRVRVCMGVRPHYLSGPVPKALHASVLYIRIYT